MSVDVGVGQLVEELAQRGDRLPFEIGAFVALEACEGLLQEAVRLEADDVRVTAEGSVVVASSAERSGPDEAARSLVSVLSRLLVAAGPGVPPYLLQLVRESAEGQHPGDLRHLHDAIEASLIPLNRGASRRVLARLVRESDRPPALEEVSIDAQELDAELDELLGDPASRSLDPVEGRPPNDLEPVTAKITIPRGEQVVTGSAPEPELEPEPEAQLESPSEGDPVPATGSVVVSEQLRVESAPPASSIAVAAATAEAPVEVPEDEVVTATIRVRFPEQEPATARIPIDQGPPPELKPASQARLQSATETTAQWALSSDAPATETTPPALTESSVPPVTRPPTPSARRPALVPWLLVLGAAGAVVALVTTGALDRFTAPQAVAPTIAPRDGTVLVSVEPADAQLFVFVGRGPARAEGLAAGGAHEFVVLDEGLAPSRAAIPEGATWTNAADGPLYELAVQARPATSKGASLSLGDPLLAPGGGANTTGTVRIITNPPGAKVYRFVATGPAVSLPVGSIDEGHEILVYHPERGLRREVIGPSDWRTIEPNGTYEARLDIALPEPPSGDVADPADD